MLVGENGIISQAKQAKENNKEAEAREKLEVVLLNAQIEKKTNIEYNEMEFLDSIITNQINGAKVRGDVAIVDGYAYELDRSIPKVGKYLLKEEKLIFPKVSVSTPDIASDNRSATFTITAQEKTNGINRIEIWRTGEKIKEYEYNNIKEEIEETYTVKRNGIYTVKVYAELSESIKTTVEGITAEVEFSPNGNRQYQNEHSVKIVAIETNEKIKNIKYKWTTNVQEPKEEEFIESCINKSTITGKGITGKYYLWILIETETGKKNICGSEAFYFDNTAPKIEVSSTPNSEKSFTLTATAIDEHSGIAQYEFYVDNKLVDTQTTTEETASYTWTGEGMSEKECFVVVTDNLKNESRVTKVARTKLYTWEKWDVKMSKQYREVLGEVTGPHDGEYDFYEQFADGYTINQATGTFELNSTTVMYPDNDKPGYRISKDKKMVSQYSLNEIVRNKSIINEK
ncbi:MAG: hypothetical protein HFJ55_05905 [Clostridia bacterium]|jgi:hypothetical protein|nr:hypothetical protein [Clostridia bacterium]